MCSGSCPALWGLPCILQQQACHGLTCATSCCHDAFDMAPAQYAFKSPHAQYPVIKVPSAWLHTSDEACMPISCAVGCACRFGNVLPAAVVSCFLHRFCKHMSKSTHLAARTRKAHLDTVPALMTCSAADMMMTAPESLLSSQNESSLCTVHTGATCRAARAKCKERNACHHPLGVCCSSNKSGTRSRAAHRAHRAARGSDS